MSLAFTAMNRRSEKFRKPAARIEKELTIQKLMAIERMRLAKRGSPDWVWNRKIAGLCGDLMTILDDV